jgi:signal transduction histidine kinase
VGSGAVASRRAGSGVSRPRSSGVDLQLGAALGACLILGTLFVARLQDHRPLPLDADGALLVLLAAMVTVTLRRVAPVVALLGAIVVVNGYLILGYPYGPIQLCIVVAMFEAARQLPTRVSPVVCGVAAVLTAGTAVVRLASDTSEPQWLALAWTSWLIVPWSLGSLAHVAAAARERSQRELVARAALEERMRIAGEVHDVAGHGPALVAMQAGVGLLVFESCRPCWPRRPALSSPQDRTPDTQRGVPADPAATHRAYESGPCGGE